MIKILKELNLYLDNDLFQTKQNKTNLIEKYYKSLLNGYLDINEEWSNDFVIELMQNKFQKTENKMEFIQTILDTYDTKDDKTRNILEKYMRAIRNNKI